VTVRVAHHPPSPPIAPFDAQTALIMNLFDPPDTSNGYISRQGVREDHSDPTRTINLAKWVVTAPYTDENEEISPPNKKIRTLTVNYERNFRTTTSILRQTLLRPFKIIFPKYFCLNYPREKAISLEQAYSLFRFLEATAAPGTQIGTPPRLTRVGPPK